MKLIYRQVMTALKTHAKLTKHQLREFYLELDGDPHFEFLRDVLTPEIARMFPAEFHMPKEKQTVK